MSRPLQILLDMDGVLADFASEALRILNMHTGKNVSVADLNGRYRLEAVYGVTTNELWRFLEEPREFWLFLEPYAWAQELLEYLKVWGDVTIATAPVSDPDCARQKLDWLSEHFNISGRHVMIGSKKHLMAHPNHLLVDDLRSNVVSFRQHGGQAILLPSPWNAGNPGRAAVFACLDAYFEGGGA